MRKLNYKINELINELRHRRIVIFGIGEYFKGYISEKFPVFLLDNIIYAVDNNKENLEIQIANKKIPVFHPCKLKDERECVILLTSTNEMYSMYQQLNDLRLDDSIDCCAVPLAFAHFIGKKNTELCEEVFDERRMKRINKIIHSFWFSGDEKPESYKRCIDSWHEMCPDYEIIEWNTDNYDYIKHPFMKQAIEKKRWAFASDYARLDVVYRMGGVYMDMDVELLKPLDCLLGNKAFFTFDANCDIDLGTFGAEKGCFFLKELMQLYDNMEFSGTMEVMNYFCQPRYIRGGLKKIGVQLDGNTQCIDDMIFLSRNYLCPMDSIVYQMKGLSESTIAIHRYNAGWKEENYRDMRILKNRQLESLFSK